MGLFKKKKSDFIDLGERYKKQQDKIESSVSRTLAESEKEKRASENTNSNANFFNMFNSDNSNSSVSESSDSSGVYGDTVNPDEKRRRLTRRLKEMTDKLENISNQIYHLQQRMELVEKKLNISKY